jgi:hypothetical protein
MEDDWGVDSSRINRGGVVVVVVVVVVVPGANEHCAAGTASDTLSTAPNELLRAELFC